MQPSETKSDFSNMPLFDTHAHLTDEQLQANIENYLQLAQQTGLVGVVSIGTDLESSLDGVKLAEGTMPQNSMQIFASAGVHPNHCQEATDKDWQEICNLAQHSRVVAIGETGLDRHWNFSSIELQREWFARHIDLSFELRKPLVIHMRDCESDIIEMLEQHQRGGKIMGIMHSFAGSWETAERCLDWGMMISFAGMVTFKKSTELREIAAEIPEDRILIETDSPYLTPHPHRGRRPNHPGMVRFTAECLAETRGVTVEEIAVLTTCNARRIFGLGR